MEYEQTREQIINVATQKANMGRPVPMDLGQMEKGENEKGENSQMEWKTDWENEWNTDAVNKGGGKGWKGGGKGKGQMKCYACGEFGHLARDCAWDKKKIGGWKRKGKGGKGEYKGKGKGDQKGKGKGKGFQGNCYNCGKFGHSPREDRRRH